MPRPLNIPDRKVVERIFREEAEAAREPLEDVLGECNRPNVVVARRRAIKRVLAETECSQEGLAVAWGGSARTIGEASRARTPNSATPLYDANTIERLRWAHGEDRTAEIIAGRDAETLADIAAWRTIGEGRR